MELRSSRPAATTSTLTPAVVAAVRNYRAESHTVTGEVVGSLISAAIFVALWAAFYFGFGWGIFWPILLIVIGAGILLRDYWPWNSRD